jgi:hypothetical protein
VRRFLLTLLASSLLGAAPARVHGFNFYQIGSNILRWNPASPLLKPTAMNPETKAIRYYIAADAYSTANSTNEIAAIRAAFDQWQGIPGTAVRFEFMGLLPAGSAAALYDDKNVVFWQKKALPQELQGRRALTTPVYSVDGSILDADIVLNGVQYQWFTDPNDTVNQAQFVEAIVLHEIGHLLGLDHAVAGGATVIDAANGINTNLGLSADDMAAARFLYPGNTSAKSSIRGVVRMNGSGILGAIVTAEDAAGNIAGATLTQASGAYGLYALPAGAYKVHVSPLDPKSSGNTSLQRGEEVAVDYVNAITAFLPGADIPVTLGANEAKTQDISVTAGEPPVRITGISKPSTIADLATTVRYAVALTEGQTGYFVGVNSPNIQPGATLSVTGDGITVGPAQFYSKKVGPGIHSLVAPISVSSNAMPGLRTFVVSQNGALAYANGYLEIRKAIPDDNYDGFDDRFQRRYWKLWTAPEAAPAADPDADGFSNGFEYRTDTNPINPSSNRLSLQPPARGRFGPYVAWVSDPGKSYQVYERSDLFSAWQPFGQPVTAAGDVWSVPVTFDAPARLYRLELKR